MARGQRTLKTLVVSLGCAKNLVDSERVLGGLGDLNLKIIDDPAEADLLLVNTCAFIEPAVRESLATIFDLHAQKKPGAKLVVLGCLPSRDPENLGVDLPEADLVVEPKNYPLLPGLLTKLFSKISKTGPGTEPGAMPGTPGPFESWPRRLSTPPWRAYLKVAEGCNHKCSYCLIPLLRGPLAVRPLSDLVNEAQILADQGVRELTLVAQDLTAWQEKDLDLGDLVRHLAAISDLKWLRLMYAYPERLSEKLLDKIARTPKVVPYLDLPLQHASMAILKRMGRPAGQILPLIRRLRIRWPQLALRTTFMVGFPGETEKDFEILRQTVEEARFEHLGVFRFEAEDKVRASSFPDQISSAVKKKRQALIMGLQKKISQNLNRARIGAEYEVLTELPAPDSPLIMTGRTPFQAPEVDGVVYFDGEQPMSGQIVRARVIKAGAYDLAVSWTPDEEYFRKKFK